MYTNKAALVEQTLKARRAFDAFLRLVRDQDEAIGVIVDGEELDAIARAHGAAMLEMTLLGHLVRKGASEP